MTHLIKAFINYGGLQGLYPNVPEEGPQDARIVERNDFISANGQRVSYTIGSRRIYSVTFPWQTDALKAEWLTFWDAVKGGAVFQYYDDDSIPIAGTGTIASTTLIAGSTSASDAVVMINMRIENTEFLIEQGEVSGYWTVSLQMREVV